MPGKTSPSKIRNAERGYHRGAARSIDVVLKFAETHGLDDEETLSLVRSFRTTICGMVDSPDKPERFIDTAINRALAELNSANEVSA